MARYAEEATPANCFGADARGGWRNMLRKELALDRSSTQHTHMNRIFASSKRGTSASASRSQVRAGEARASHPRPWNQLLTMGSALPIAASLAS